MTRTLFRYLQPTFCAGLLDDPVLLVNIRPLGRSILVDCGQIHHLAKRILKSLDAVFISHAHMDHFMGFDTLVRHVHVSPRIIDLFGPPGLAGKVASKLAGYDWNLAEPGWCIFRVHEVFPDRLQNFHFPGADGFPCVPQGEQPRLGREIYRNDFLTVEAESCDHRIPSLTFRLTERPTFWIDEEKIAGLGLARGEWLRELKRRFYRGELDTGPITVASFRGKEIVEEEITDARGLFEGIRRTQEPASIGYLTDIGFSDENLVKVRDFLADVTLLACDCSFLAADQEKARASHHLCTSDVNELARELRPTLLLPMHLSKTYNGKSDRLYEELDPPPEIRLIRLPEHLTPRPLIPAEFPPLLRPRRTYSDN